MRLSFEGRSAPDVGVVLEVQLLDSETLEPRPAAPSLLSQLAHEPRIRPSLYQSALLLATPIFMQVEQVGLELARLLNVVQALCEPMGLVIMSTGTHPSAGWRDLHLSNLPQYESFIRRLQWVGRRAAVFGLRIHVGVPDGEKAIALGNSLTSLIPLLVAFSGSSPYWRGHDTGLASCRVRVIENIPNAGLPPNLLNFGEFQAYVKTLRAAETIERISDIWWDVRPNLQEGTLELQVCDSPHTIREVLALTALVQALVTWMLKRYEEGEPIPSAEAWIARENKWRAARFGLDAELVNSNEGDLLNIRGLFAQMCERLSDAIDHHQLEPHFSVLEELFRVGPGYARQREAVARRGCGAAQWLAVQELRLDEPLTL